MGHEKVPHGFGLTGDHGGDMADGAGNRGVTWAMDFYFFSWDMVPRIGETEKEGLCAFLGILKDFGILMKTLSYYSKSVYLFE